MTLRTRGHCFFRQAGWWYCIGIVALMLTYTANLAPADMRGLSTDCAPRERIERIRREEAVRRAAANGSGPVDFHCFSCYT
jgi:hypothetical protein